MNARIRVRLKEDEQLAGISPIVYAFGAPNEETSNWCVMTETSVPKAPAELTQNNLTPAQMCDYWF